MEQARIFIAIALSFLVFLLWEVFFVEKKPVEKVVEEVVSTEIHKDSTETVSPIADVQQQSRIPTTESATVQTAPTRTIIIKTPLYQVSISEQGAVFKSLLLKHYKETVDKDSPFLEMVEQNIAIGTVGLQFEKKSFPYLNQAYFKANTSKDKIDVISNSEEISFVTVSENGISIEKRYTFSANSYLIDLNVVVTNNSGTTFEDQMVFTLSKTSPGNNAGYGFIGPSAYIDNRLEQIKIKKLEDKNLFTGNMDWIAYIDRYFLSAIIPEKPEEGSFRILTDDKGILDNQLVLGPTIYNSGSRIEFACHLYFGPKDTIILKSLNRGLENAVHFGFFDVLAKPCVWLMNLIYGVIPNYGLAIILLTVFIKILLWPLGTKSYKSMNEMKKIQPLMAEIREKYKDDKRKMNEEVMGLYRTYKINPMGGCLPMILQIPVFFALYRMLYEAIELRHAPFFAWINDLSAPDRLFRFDFAIPFMQEPYGIPVLTIIMGGTMFLQQKMSPPMGDPAQAKMMMLMPIIFTFIFINFSSGLVLYWLVNNILSISQQYYIQKKFA